MIAAVLFDLDDTLVAFDAVTESSWQAVVAEYCGGRGLDPQALRAAIRRVSDAWWSDPERHRVGRLDMLATRRRLVAEAFAGLGLPAGDATARGGSLPRVRLDAMHLLPGATETLSALRAAGMRLALLTNGDGETQRWKIGRFGLEGCFDTILVEGELGFGKPDPRVFELALARLGGDRRGDLHGGRQPRVGRCGAPAAGHPRGLDRPRRRRGPRRGRGRAVARHRRSLAAARGAAAALGKKEKSA